MENKWTVVMMGQFSQYLLVCLMKVMRVVAFKQKSKSINSWLRR